VISRQLRARRGKSVRVTRELAGNSLIRRESCGKHRHISRRRARASDRRAVKGPPEGGPRTVTRPSVRSERCGRRAAGRRAGCSSRCRCRAARLPRSASRCLSGLAAILDGVGDQCGFLIAHVYLLRIVKPHNGASMRARESGSPCASTGCERTRNARPSALLQRNRLCRFGGNRLTHLRAPNCFRTA
jgi:hypothetical protein